MYVCEEKKDNEIYLDENGGGIMVSFYFFFIFFFYFSIRICAPFFIHQTAHYIPDEK